VQTSQGKVLLAALPADQVAAALSQPSRSGLPSYLGRSPDQLRDELTEVRARGWALADEELAPGVRSVAVPVRDGTGTVRAAMNVTVHAAETTTQRLIREYLPLLLTTAGEISAEWAIWLSCPHVEISRRAEPGSVTA
jgi:IclR family pca regulon transcriptional regulator